MPIDQEATRLKAEANEEQARKNRGWIDINIDDSKIIIVSKSGDTPTIPSLLIDESGENKIKIVIKGGDGKELESEENDKDENKYLFSGLLSNDSITPDLLSQMNKVNDLINNFDNNWSENKKKRKQKEIKKEESKLSEIVGKNTFGITVTSSFTKDENVTKRKKVSYGWIYKKEGNVYVTEGWGVIIV